VSERDQPSPDDLGDTVDAPDQQRVPPAVGKGMVVLLSAIACTVFGAKLILISAVGSPMPFWDQWDAEAVRLYVPYLNGELSVANMFASHNEHRIVLTRFIALLHLELAGEWNTRLEMILNAIIHTTLITWLAALLMPLVAPQRRMLLACFVALLFALPIGYENTLLGLNSNFYFVILFGVAAVVLFAAARAFSPRWFGGLAAAVLSYLSLSSGAATILVAAILVSLQLATRVRERHAREFVAVLVMAAIGVAMILWIEPTGDRAFDPWTFLLGFIAIAGPTIVGVILVQVPVVWYCLHILSMRPAISGRAWVVVGIAGWVGAQVATFAYGRDDVVGVRYLDVVLIVYPVALVAVLALADRAGSTRFRHFAMPAAAAWVFVMVAGIGALGYYGSVRQAVDWWGASGRQQVVNVTAYLTTGDIANLKGKAEFDIPYPDPQRLANVLDDPDVRAILPPEIRPADADVAHARDRMHLKGALTGVTSDAVRFVLAGGPAFLAMGLGLFFAAGALRSLRSLATE
jgi:hypothetical protein